MIHPDDEQTIQRLLGSVPESARSEVELRTRMYHSGGASGSLGILGIVDALRYLHLAPQKLKGLEVDVDWRTFPQDGSVHVEALFFGAWQPGVFRGFVEAGTLNILMTDEGVHKECRKDMVRLVPDYQERMERAQLPEEEKPDARVDLLDQPPAAHAASEFTDTVSENEEDEGPEEEAPEFDWKSDAVKVGDPVLIHFADGSDEEGRICQLSKHRKQLLVCRGELGKQFWHPTDKLTYGKLVQQGG